MTVFSRALAAVAASLLIAPFAAEAAPQNYAIQFTVTQGSIAPTAGSFTYDAGVGFSAFTVVWNGVTVDLTATSNKPQLYTTAGGYFLGTAADSFALLSNTLPQPRSYTNWAAYNFSSGTFFGFASGAGTPGVSESMVSFREVRPVIGVDPTSQVQSGAFTITAVPEPQTYAMLLAGLGLMGLVARRRSSKQQ
ncbi:PEP-CTERM sorting domain-containing protein [Paucibacter sp. TC2R-5]|uniref:PEP-CTERM sorting domain-containing protein n=1 Tax=Paucibacter sp. TC2R-5 TaxID=2893555 RepID=UPI0021E50A83|nr:PEP-CTERM sorting domain-containing protein [Paucibacter sp. TC2R-5]MCV2360004.1 PEP-CTERM sorting domain-containing protein [Paucibacter sp. TC2R-5]